MAAAAEADYQQMLESTAAPSAEKDLTTKLEKEQTSAASSAEKVELVESMSFQQVKIPTQQTVDDTLRETEAMLQAMNVNLDDLPKDR